MILGALPVVLGSSVAWHLLLLGTLGPLLLVLAGVTLIMAAFRPSLRAGDQSNA